MKYVNREDVIKAIKMQIENHPISPMDKMWNAALSCAIGQVETIPSSDVIKLDEGIKIGAELAAMHGSDTTSQELEKAFFEGIEEGYKKGLSERKHGKWIYQFHEDEVGVTCSECEGYAESFAKWIYDEGFRVKHNYCPNCGAIMDE